MKNMIARPVLLTVLVCFAIVVATAQASGQTNKGEVTEQPTPNEPIFTPIEEEVIYKVVDIMPLFASCNEDLPSSDQKECADELMLAYIYDELAYPIEDQMTHLGGTCVCSFVVDTSGRLTDIKVLRSVSPTIDKEAIRIVQSMNNREDKWIAGQLAGRKVKVQYTLPIKFKVEEACQPIERLDEYPQFDDCIGDSDRECTKGRLQEFVLENQLYPQSAIEDGQEGSVTVRFLIAKNGSVSNIQSFSKVNELLIKDAIGIIEWMNEDNYHWAPGRIDGEEVCTKYELEIVYDIKEWKNRNE